MENELDILNDYRKIKEYIEGVTDYGDNKPKNELKHLEQALQQLMAIQKGKNNDYLSNLMIFKNAEPSNPFKNPNDARDNSIYLSAIVSNWSNTHNEGNTLSPKEAAFEKVQSIMDTYYTSGILSKESTLNIIDRIIKEVA